MFQKGKPRTKTKGQGGAAREGLDGCSEGSEGRYGKKCHLGRGAKGPRCPALDTETERLHIN